jgi:hypothetical protein
METAPILPDEKLHALEIFLGSWRLAGKNLPGAPTAANMMVTGNIFFQWMPGHFFMTGNWHRKYGYESHIGISLIGFDYGREAYFMENFDNLGFRREYVMRQHGANWSIEGTQERADIRFENAGLYHERWEIRKNRQWEGLCEFKVIKI